MTVFPDYHKNIVSLSNSLLKHYQAPTLHQSLSELDTVLEKTSKKNIVFMILDCMGTEILTDMLPKDSFLRQNLLTNISSVFPPTTTAATTSFHSGLYPIEHGWIGWAPYFKEYNRVIETFLNRDLYTQEVLSTPQVRDVLEYTTIYQRIKEAAPDVEYHRVFPPFDPNGVKSFDEMCQRIPQITTSSGNRKIISAYWPYPDHDLHRRGTKSTFVQAELQKMDKQLQAMASNLKDTLLIISADHGIVNVDEVFLNDYPELMSCLALPPSLEARFVSFFIKPEKKEIFAEKAAHVFEGDFLLLTKDDFLAAGFLGRGEPHQRIDGFVGDFVLIATGQKSLRYRSESGTGFQSFAADHAGLTPSELSVPVIVWASV